MTPLMDQYQRIKKRHAGDILLFRLGDFYEMFYDDARTASQILGITLTSRMKGENRIPMAGVPYHSANSYINRLLKAGRRVAVCEQTEDPEEAEGLVERAVVRVITPGTLIDDGMLDEKRNNYLCALCLNDASAGVAWIDISTGRFLVEETSAAELMDAVVRIAPSECLLPRGTAETRQDLVNRLRDASRGMITPCDDWTFDRPNALRALLEHFHTANLSGFGCDDLDAALSAAGAVLAYLKETHRSTLNHVTKLERYRRDGKVFLDRQTLSSLEIFQTSSERKREGSLLWLLDRTVTAMGSRMLQDWVTAPLRDREAVDGRLDAVGELVRDPHRRREIHQAMRNTSDVERIAAKIGSGRATPRDISGLRSSLIAFRDLRPVLDPLTSSLMRETAAGVGTHDDLIAELRRALVDDPPHLLTEGGIIRKKYDKELDAVRSIAEDGKSWIAAFEAKEIERSGIPSLKVGYNDVFGYYIEITNVHREKIPANYTRKQTLKNAERYITPELKDRETQVLNAEERRKKMEYDLFVRLRESLNARIEEIHTTARAVAAIDAVASLAQVAEENNYVRPEIDDSRAVEIEDGRHPVLEKVLEDPFVPNDARLDGEGRRVIIITGPNMAGKSTYIRQVALIALMAQMGSFVPARRARIGLVDRVFTRIGASDELSRGASTFMVEMNETANILNNATDRSMIILDEIGRGTSTFDGVSIAWAIVEHLHDNVRARTLFATHYHELTELGLVLEGVKNCHIAVREWKESIVFLRKIVEGGTDKSYGIHVARLAGIPRGVVERAKAILGELEALTLDAQDMPVLAKGKVASSGGPSSVGKTRSRPGDMAQLALFVPASSAIAKPAVDPAVTEILRDLRAIDPDTLTPIDALRILDSLRRKAPTEKS